MTTKNQTHTPTPWEIIPDTEWQGLHPLHDNRFIGNNKTIVCALRDQQTQKADADFIIRAVNSHDALVEASRLILEEYDNLLEELSDKKNQCIVNNAPGYKKLQAALKAAGEL